MVINEWQKKYIESGLFTYDRIKDSVLVGDQMMVKAIKMARRFFVEQGQGGELQVAFIDNFYKKYESRVPKIKKGVYHKIVCQELNIEQAAGYVIRNEIVLRVALGAATIGLMKFE